MYWLDLKYILKYKNIHIIIFLYIYLLVQNVILHYSLSKKIISFNKVLKIIGV